MKVAIIGGYGVFGSRLCRLLTRDGHDVVVVGRNADSAKALAEDIGAMSLALDRSADLAPLWALDIDAVVDAAGPFHAYGDDPYRLAKDAIAHRVHYLDLADDADFCAGIVALDQDAKDAGVFVLSGMSSVPALSSAAVAHLAKDVDAIDTIETAILPGNKAPRGQAVIDSILHQAGTDIDVTIDGTVTQVQSWSLSRMFDLPGNLKRRGYAIRVPDQPLFPAFFNARTVKFHAGLEVGLMNHGLAAFAWVRHKIGFGIPGWLTKATRRAAQLLAWMGTNTGGMTVRVVVRVGDQWQARTWRLLAREGEGPYIPAISVRAILRNPDLSQAGARPGLAVFDLADAEAAMTDLAVETDTQSVDLTPLFPKVLGPAFAQLDPAVRRSHQIYGVRRLSGTAQITRGAGIWPSVLAKLFGFPKAANDVPVTVTKSATPKGERWTRAFGDQVFHSHLSQGQNGMTETFGPFTFDLGLHVENGHLCFPVTAGRCFGVPMPRMFLPQSDAKEADVDGAFTFDVALKAPLTGQLIVRYQGRLSL